MTITNRPSSAAPSLLGGSIELPARTCRHADQPLVAPWQGAPGTAGRVTIVGAGKMGLPLAVQFAGHGWDVTAVDVQPAVVDSINAGKNHVTEEPGLTEGVASAHAAGRLRATLDGAAAAATADVVVLIVPVMLDDEQQPDYRYMDAAVESIAPGVHPGSTVIFETTLPVGDTRNRFGPRLEAVSGLAIEGDFFVAFSPERLYSGSALRNLATYPKLVGGLGPESGARAAAFYGSVLDAEIVLMSSAEAAEFSKLADTTYRDVNIALANEFARYADRVGVDIQEVIAAANSQPYSHIHQPGLGVGGHCIPVYPHFLLSRAPEMELVELSRRVNDGQIGLAIRTIQKALGGLEGVPVLVLGLTYRDGVKELAYSRALPLIERLAFHGAIVEAYDPLLSTAEIDRSAASPYAWGTPSRARAIITQTADPLFASLDFGLFPEAELLFDGRNSLRQLSLPERIAYHGVGVPASARGVVEAAAR
jgi:nucleotide sugar dehydrogenase